MSFCFKAGSGLHYNLCRGTIGHAPRLLFCIHDSNAGELLSVDGL